MKQQKKVGGEKGKVESKDQSENKARKEEFKGEAFSITRKINSGVED